jgi:S-adenosyl-L-methionine hydrolase (adenosine-forming)
MPIITLTTDFGLADGYVGIMKGVILGILPDVQLVDLSHDIAPQNVRQAAYVLAQASPYFPEATVHLAVVDPGVGTARRPIIVRTPRALYVGPDNGLFSAALAETDSQAWELEREEYWLPHMSATFHGRDVFAPVAAHAARGVPPGQMGRPIDDAVRLLQAAPARRADGTIAGLVVHVDRFGNLITDVPAAWVAGGRWKCQVAGRQQEATLYLVGGVSPTYAHVAPGALAALIGSSGTVEIAMRDGNAATALGVSTGEMILILPQP